MEAPKIIFLCLAMICGFGAAYGELASLACPDAFTLGRPPLFGHLPPSLLGPIWGIVDFLTPGAMIGIALAMSSHIGHRPIPKAFFFKKPMLAHLVLMSIAAAAGALLGFFAVKNGDYPIIGPLKTALPPDQYPILGAVWWSGFAAHIANFASGSALVIWVWRKRILFERIISEKKA